MFHIQKSVSVCQRLRYVVETPAVETTRHYASLTSIISTKSRQKTCDGKVCMIYWSTRNCTRHIIGLQRLALRLSFQQSEVAIPSEIFISLCGKIFFPLASFIYKINQKLMKSISKFEIELKLLVYKWKVPNLIIWDIIWPSLTPS